MGLYLNYPWAFQLCRRHGLITTGQRCLRSLDLSLWPLSNRDSLLHMELNHDKIAIRLKGSIVITDRHFPLHRDEY